ncbi:hypothetical protein CYMTET_26086 [Cymbomonas tetramitiformis]|uniref:Uncharacterized protein n=1 Tax=Cymbomonas tetramitiformis TaxID=36881 RepID=A0AAE0KYE6_9CHLO|nr:hypothetical protein CYMTET_26086 [Cymbomonas tetramitiformis]
MSRWYLVVYRPENNASGFRCSLNSHALRRGCLGVMWRHAMLDHFASASVLFHERFPNRADIVPLSKPPSVPP